MNNLIKVIVVILLAQLSACSKKMYQPYQIEYENARVNSSITGKNEKLEKMIAPYRTELDKTMNEVLAVSDQEFKKGAYESLLGNWVCDGIKWYMDSVLKAPNDFAICNYGGLRVQSLPKGNITLSNIFELMPFDNKITAVVMDSNTMLNVTKKISAFKGIPVSRGINISLDKANNIKNWSSHQTIKDSFVLVATDYIVNGGDRMDIFANSRKISYEVKLRDVLVDYAKHQKKLHAELEGRIVKVEE
jgi:2',3'-cyclic-nucleotide 2'-phosphodiesterase (5'-nucleotidase family)